MPRPRAQVPLHALKSDAARFKLLFRPRDMRRPDRVHQPHHLRHDTHHLHRGHQSARTHQRGRPQKKHHMHAPLLPARTRGCIPQWRGIETTPRALRSRFFCHGRQYQCHWRKTERSSESKKAKKTKKKTKKEEKKRKRTATVKDTNDDNSDKATRDANVDT